MKKHIENMAEEILQEYTNCYSEVDQECLEKMLFKLASEVRADTVKKMQERLKEAVKNIPWCDYPPVHNVIDQIAKEILEGTQND